MRDIVSDLQRMLAAEGRVAIATVLETWGSAPRVAGSKLAVAPSGSVAGSVSGGCVEGAVVEIAQRVLATGRPERARFGVADETAWAVGLACGGSIEVCVDAPSHDLLARVMGETRDGRPVALVTRLDDALGACAVVSGGDVAGVLPRDATTAIMEAARAGFVDGRSRRVGVNVAGRPAEFFVDVTAAAPTLVIVGGVHIAVALDPMARALGYRTMIVDPRTAFGNAQRFPSADGIMREWPDDALRQLSLGPSSAVVVLTHDPKLDDPALLVALRSDAFYVGALGSKKTQEKRGTRLREAGLTEDQIGRLRAPIGLDLGGRSPEEIALAIMAQIVAVRNGKA